MKDAYRITLLLHQPQSSLLLQAAPALVQEHVLGHSLSPIFLQEQELEH